MKATYISLLIALVSFAATASNTPPLTGSLAGDTAVDAPLIVQNPEDLTFALTPEYQFKDGTRNVRVLDKVDVSEITPSFELTKPTSPPVPLYKSRIEKISELTELPRPPVPMYQPRVEMAGGATISPGSPAPQRNKNVTEIGARFNF